MKRETLYIAFHQVMFLLTGLCTTLGTQWLFYHGAASKFIQLFDISRLSACFFQAGDSYLAQLAQYIGMVLVGLIIPILLKNKQNGYSKLNQTTEEEEFIHDINMVQVETTPEITKNQYQEGPVPHKSVMKLALLDVFANFCVTVGFSIVGSGVRWMMSYRLFN